MTQYNRSSKLVRSSRSTRPTTFQPQPRTKRYVVLLGKNRLSYQVVDTYSGKIIASFHDDCACDRATAYAADENQRNQSNLLTTLLYLTTCGIGAYILYDYFFQSLNNQNWPIVGAIAAWLIFGAILVVRK